MVSLIVLENLLLLALEIHCPAEQKSQSPNHHTRHNEHISHPVDPVSGSPVDWPDCQGVRHVDPEHVEEHQHYECHELGRDEPVAAEYEVQQQQEQGHGMPVHVVEEVPVWVGGVEDGPVGGRDDHLRAEHSLEYDLGKLVQPRQHFAEDPGLHNDEEVEPGEKVAHIGEIDPPVEESLRIREIVQVETSEIQGCHHPDYQQDSTIYW